MDEVSDRDDQAKAVVARELFLLGQKTVEARAVLAALHKELRAANAQLADKQQIEDLIEANQQLVLAILSAQSTAEKPQTAEAAEQQQLYLDMREANELLVIAALSAQHLKTSAERALERQRSVLALVAHEMRNPLNPISMIAGRLARVPSEELPRMQQLIEGQVRHMTRLVEDLLDVSRVKTGKFRLDCQRVDIVQIIQESIDNCRPVMLSSDLHFVAEIPDCALSMSVDPVRLAQILGNLLGNAAKYTPAGGSVTLSVTVEVQVVQISIRDSGIGISAKALPFIFEPFVQDVHAIDFNGAGLGIGLTVVRELVESHGGTVIGNSAGDGQGSEFVVRLPLASP